VRPRARAVVSGVDLAARATGLAKPPPLEADHATAPAPYRKTGVAPRREVLNCRPSTGGRFIRGHPSTRLRQIRPAVDGASHSPSRSRVPTKAPTARAIQRAARGLCPTRPCVEFRLLEVMLFCFRGAKMHSQAHRTSVRKSHVHVSKMAYSSKRDNAGMS